MTEFQIHDLDSAPGASRPILARLKSEVGFLPNLAASMAESSVLLEGFTSLRRIAGGGSLDALEREVVSLAVSRANLCTYCMAAHSTFARRQGAPDELLRALRGGETVGDPRHEALRSFSHAVVARRGPLSPETRRSFLDSGFTRAQMLEVLAVIAMTSLANQVHHVTEAPVDEAFEDQEWAVPA